MRKAFLLSSVFGALCILLLIGLIRNTHRPSGLYVQYDNTIISIGSGVSKNQSAVNSDMKQRGHLKFGLDRYLYDKATNSVFYVNIPNLMKYDIKENRLTIVKSPGNVTSFSRLDDHALLVASCNEDFSQTTISHYRMDDDSWNFSAPVPQEGIAFSIDCAGRYIACDMAKTQDAERSVIILDAQNNSMEFSTQGLRPHFVNDSTVIYEHDETVMSYNLSEKKETAVLEGSNLSLSPNRQYLAISRMGSSNDSDDIVIFKIQNEDLKLLVAPEKIGETTVPSPFAMKLPIGWSTSSKSAFYVTSLEKWNRSQEFVSREATVYSFDLQKNKWEQFYHHRSKDFDTPSISGAFIIDR